MARQYLQRSLKYIPNNQQRSFEDARGLVVNDYQNYLEQKWIEQLKKKYPVTVNQKVFQSLLNIQLNAFSFICF